DGVEKLPRGLASEGCREDAIGGDLFPASQLQGHQADVAAGELPGLARSGGGKDHFVRDFQARHSNGGTIGGSASDWAEARPSATAFLRDLAPPGGRTTVPARGKAARISAGLP